MRAIRAPSVVPLPTAALHLGALSALAVAQPLFDLVSKNPDFLAARRLIGWQVVGLGLVLVLVPPLLALGVEALARARWQRRRCLAWNSVVLVSGGCAPVWRGWRAECA